MNKTLFISLGGNKRQKKILLVIIPVMLFLTLSWYKQKKHSLYMSELLNPKKITEIKKMCKISRQNLG